MRGSLYMPPDTRPAPPPAQACAPQGGMPAFLPFDAQAFALASKRHVPVFLVIGELPMELAEPSLAAQIAERTVPVHLWPGQRSDVEALCLRASVLFSEEGALPLCALLLPNACPFLAAPLPPPGYPLDASRLLVWLTHADRRFCQNLPAFSAQASQVVRTLHAPPLRKPYPPHDAAHDVSRALAPEETAPRTPPSPARWTRCSPPRSTTRWTAASSAPRSRTTGAPSCRRSPSG